MSFARDSYQSRSQTPRTDGPAAIAHALSVAEGLGARYAGAIALLRACLTGGTDAPAVALRQRLAGSDASLPLLQELVERYDRLAALERQQRAAFEQAQALAQPPLRALALAQIPHVQLMRAGAALAEAVDACAGNAVLAQLFAAAASRSPSSALPQATRGAAGPTTTSAAPGTASVPPAGADPLAVGKQQEAELALQKLVRGVNQLRPVFAYTADRIALVEGGVAVYRQPTRPPRTVLGGVTPQAVAIAIGLARIYADKPPALRHSQIAITQTQDARRALVEADVKLERMAKVPPAAALVVAQGFNLPSLRGKLAVLMGFPRTFKGQPLLEDIFPAM